MLTLKHKKRNDDHIQKQVILQWLTLPFFQVTNVHQVVQFRQKPWMKEEYIEYNTRQRAQAASEFEKEF